MTLEMLMGVSYVSIYMHEAIKGVRYVVEATEGDPPFTALDVGGYTRQ